MKLDLSNRNLKKIDLSFIKQSLNTLGDNESHEVTDISIEIACFDNNHLSKLENLDQFVNLKNVFISCKNFKKFAN
jgi:hypothetical protein